MTDPAHDPLALALRTLRGSTTDAEGHRDAEDADALRRILRAGGHDVLPDAWQPIATAPKGSTTPTEHGRHVQTPALLGFCPGESTHRADCILVIWWEPHIGDTGAWWCDADWAVEPTHWRPLPAPPEGGGAP